MSGRGSRYRWVALAFAAPGALLMVAVFVLDSSSTLPYALGQVLRLAAVVLMGIGVVFTLLANKAQKATGR
jgi:hypothetical protein